MDRVSRSQYFKQHLSGLTPLQRHQQLVLEALQDPPAPQAKGAAGPAALHATETDFDALRKHHRFLRGPEDDAQQGGNSWGARLARRYYSRLFKEYAIADLSRYKESKIGLRWRTQAEVVAGKGQFTCGSKGCDGAAGLSAYEVNFAYQEEGQAKQALVKLCLCEDCAYRLNFRRDSGKQYRKLGGSSVFDQQQEQQQQWQHTQGAAEQRQQQGSKSRREQEREPLQQQALQWERQPVAALDHDRHGWQGARAQVSQPDLGRSSSHRSRSSSHSKEAGDRLHPQQQQWERGRSRSAGCSKRQWDGDADAEAARFPLSRYGSGGSSKRARADGGAAGMQERAASAGQPAVADGGGRSVSGEDRWQLDHGVEHLLGAAAAVTSAAVAAVATDAGALPAPAGAGDGLDRWVLEDGELNDRDIESWLDSLFTAVPAAAAAGAT